MTARQGAAVPCKAINNPGLFPPTLANSLKSQVKTLGPNSHWARGRRGQNNSILSGLNHETESVLLGGGGWQSAGQGPCSLHHQLPYSLWAISGKLFRDEAENGVHVTWWLRSELSHGFHLSKTKSKKTQQPPQAAQRHLQQETL